MSLGPLKFSYKKENAEPEQVLGYLKVTVCRLNYDTTLLIELLIFEKILQEACCVITEKENKDFFLGGGGGDCGGGLVDCRNKLVYRKN